MKRLLIVSPHFPPVNAPDMYRAVSSLPYLAELGWQASVLCVDARDVAAPGDKGLESSIPKEVKVERCRAVPLAVSRLAGMRTLSWRAWRSMDRAGDRMIRAERPDLALFTTTQFPLVSLGARWKSRFGLPYVVDIQDPWLTDYYSRPGSPKPPGGWKYTLARSIAARMEPRAFAPADGFISVSEAYLNSLAARYAWFGEKPKATIPFGIDERAFARAMASAKPAFAREDGCLHLVSVGAAGPIMERGLHALFKQLAALRRAGPHEARNMRFHFIGTSYATGSDARPSVAPIAEAHGVGDLVTEQVSRVDWNVAQATMKAADGILVLASDDLGYTPSKFSGAFLAARPGLVVAPPGSSAARVNQELGFGELLDPSGGTPSSLGDFVTGIRSDDSAWRSRRAEALFLSRYTAKARTAQMATFLDRLLGALKEGVPA